MSGSASRRGPAAWRRAGSVAFVSSPGRVALLDLARPASPAQILEGPGAAIWAAVEGARTTTAIVDAVAAEYGVAPENVRADVEAFLGSLVDHGLVEAQ